MSKESKKKNPNCPEGGKTPHPDLDNRVCPGEQGASAQKQPEPPECEKKENISDIKMSKESKKQNPNCPEGGKTHHPDLDNRECLGAQSASAQKKPEPPECGKKENISDKKMPKESKKQNPDCAAGGITHHPGLDNFECPGGADPQNQPKPPKCEKKEMSDKKKKGKSYECNLDGPPPDDPCASPKKS